MDIIEKIQEMLIDPKSTKEDVKTTLDDLLKEKKEYDDKEYFADEDIIEELDEYNTIEMSVLPNCDMCNTCNSDNGVILSGVIDPKYFKKFTF